MPLPMAFPLLPSHPLPLALQHSLRFAPTWPLLQLGCAACAYHWPHVAMLSGVCAPSMKYNSRLTAAPGAASALPVDVSACPGCVATPFVACAEAGPSGAAVAAPLLVPLPLLVVVVVLLLKVCWL